MKNPQLAEYEQKVLSGNLDPDDVVIWLRMSLAAMRAKASQLDD